MEKFTVANSVYEIRKFDESVDSIDEITDLLHRAYKRLADMGLNFVATHQDSDETRTRLVKGDGFVLYTAGKLVGTITLYKERSKSRCEWYRNQGVSYFGQFAVEPGLQNNGIGSRLMEFIEDYAKQNGLGEIALDTSEKALHLIDYYTKRGYRFIQYHQWDRVNYRSVVMSKKLGIQ